MVFTGKDLLEEEEQLHGCQRNRRALPTQFWSPEGDDFTISLGLEAENIHTCDPVIEIGKLRISLFAKCLKASAEGAVATQLYKQIAETQAKSVPTVFSVTDDLQSDGGN